MFVLFAWAWYAWASRRETGAMATVVAHRVRGGGYTAPRPADIQPRTRRSHHCLETTARDPPAVLLPRPVRLHPGGDHARSEEHTSELQSLMRSSYAVFCLNKKKTIYLS